MIESMKERAVEEVIIEIIGVEDRYTALNDIMERGALIGF